MIRSLRLKDFKNFADETLRVGPFTVIVGTNASGKSNIRDAFRFLHGIGRGYTLAEIVGGKYGAGGQVERIHLEFLEENGARVSAYSASDGTLRFLAMLAALLGSDPAHLYFFEEIDNGIHPARLRLLLDLIERQTAKDKVQVVTTTHSTDLLSMVGDRTFENTSVACRLEGTRNAIIRLVRDLPDAGDLRKSQGLGRLLVGGWMETALAFTEGSEDDGEASE